MKDFSEKLRNLPQTPGVYLMKDINGRIIYVGKAKVLKNRVSQYFHKSANHHPKTISMVANIDTFDWIVTDSEVDALILECNLIKKHSPKYNILRKDDKKYPFIKITNESFPRIQLTRDKIQDGARYFGQFISGLAVKDNIELLRKIFKMRNCSRNLPRDIGKGRPCLMYHIKHCSAPCANKITADEYRENVEQAIMILDGKFEGITAELEAQMQIAAENLEFERAARIRDKIKHIKVLGEQRPSGSLTSDNIFATADEIERGDDKFENGTNDVGDAHPGVPREENSSLKGRPGVRPLHDLSNILSLPAPPKRIELYDISNISGEMSVGVCVVFENAKPNRKHYRKFNIKTVDGADDYASMREVIYRRINRAYDELDKVSQGELEEQHTKFLPLPDLILLDGGRGHVSTIKELFATLGEEIPVFGIVKDNKHRTRGLTSDTSEFIIPKNSDLFRHLTEMQDEVHRFAISAYRKRHENKLVQSELTAIPNVGDATRRKLLAHFKSIKRIKTATFDELCGVVNKRIAKSICDFFKNT